MSSPQLKITWKYALSVYGGNQSELGRALGLARSTINPWRNKKYIPEYHAFRLREMNPRAISKKKLANQ